MSKASKLLQLLEGYHEPTEDEKTKFKAAASKMIATIKAKNPDWEDTDGSIEQAFFDNMIKLTRGDFQ